METNLTDSIKNNTGILSTTLAMPGSANSNTVGYIPSYNKILGIFDFSVAPILFVTTQKVITNEFLSSPSDPKYIYDYSIAHFHGRLDGLRYKVIQRLQMMGQQLKLQELMCLLLINKDTTLNSDLPKILQYRSF